MKPKLLALLLLVGSAGCAGPRYGAGFAIGPPPPPPAVAYAPPPRPGPAYVWVPGYWDLAGSRYSWRSGYWAVPPHPHARWVAPRYHGRHYYSGYWRR